MSGYIGTQPVPQATQSRDSFTATSNQTTFATAGYQPGYIDVYLNGVHLVDVTDYTATNGSDVVLASGASVNDIVEVVAYSTFEVLNQTLTGTTTVDVLNVTGAFTSLGIDDNATSTAITLSSGGNVGIGTSSPQAKLQVLDQLKVSSADQSSGAVVLGDGSSTSFNVGIARWNGSTNAAGAGGVGYFSQGSVNAGGHYFYTGDAAAGSTTERMRIDSSGNLLVGTTSTIPFTFSSGTGAGITSAGTVMAGATAEAGLFNRIGSDGSIVNFYKAGAIVGSIGTSGGAVTIGKGITTLKYLDSLDTIHPNGTGSGSDGLTSLGWSNNRFKDLYLSGGVYLGGTVAANKLDDYEEGTFVPTLGGTTTYNGAAGFYTKVGQVVSVQCFVNIASLNTPKNGNHYIQGLPFAASGQESYMGVHYFYNCAVNMSYLAFRATGYDMWPTFAGSPSGSMGVNPAIFQNNTQVYIAGVYRTTQ